MQGKFFQGGGNLPSRRYGRLFFVVGSLTLSLILSARFSFVQSEQPPSLPDLQSVLPQAKLSHPACPTCFTYACPDCYTIMEEIPGTGLTIARQIPNPAPLEPDEQRLEFDPETGLPIWYIGRQPYVGPTDEQPYSAQYPVPLIQLKRIHARVQDKIFSIPGVHAFGIGGKGFVVYLEPEQSVNEVLVPQELEGVPVEVEVTDAFAPTSHDATTFRPVPSGVAIQGGQGLGTVGPHIVRTARGTRQFRIQYVCLVNYERNIALGDSGALVAGNGSGNRHVFGVHIARSPSQNNQGAFILAGDIQTAFTNSGFSFSHFWGTASGRSDLWWPAATQCDGSC